MGGGVKDCAEREPAIRRRVAALRCGGFTRMVTGIIGPCATGLPGTVVGAFAGTVPMTEPPPEHPATMAAPSGTPKDAITKLLRANELYLTCLRGFAVRCLTLRYERVARVTAVKGCKPVAVRLLRSAKDRQTEKSHAVQVSNDSHSVFGKRILVLMASRYLRLPARLPLPRSNPPTSRSSRKKSAR